MSDPERAEAPGYAPLTLFRVTVYMVIVVGAVGIPLLLNLADARFLDDSLGRGYAITGLFAFSGTAAIVVIGGMELRRRWASGWSAMLPVVLATVLGFHFLVPLSESRGPTSDYLRYETAAKDVLTNQNPYAIGGARKYLYPPMPALVLASAYRGVQAIQRALGYPAASEHSWRAVFYLYQCTQFLLVLLAYPLCYRIARDMGVESLHAHVLGVAVLILNTPLAMTLRHNQVNLLTLDLALLGLWSARRWPIGSGLAIALAAHVKLYPIVLLLPLAAARRWRAVAWTVATLVGITLAQTGFGRDWTLWKEFLAFFVGGFPTQHEAIRNSSILSVYFSACRVLRDHCASYLPALRHLALATSTVVAGWFAFRCVERTRMLTRALRGEGILGVPAAGHLYAFGAEALAVALLLSPTVWDHHYLLAVPLVLSAVAIRGRDQPWQVGIGTVLVIAVPIFGYHRIVGMLLLLALLSPRLGVGGRPESREQGSPSG